MIVIDVYSRCVLEEGEKKEEEEEGEEGEERVEKEDGMLFLDQGFEAYLAFHRLHGSTGSPERSARRISTRSTSIIDKRLT